MWGRQASAARTLDAAGAPRGKLKPTGRSTGNGRPAATTARAAKTAPAANPGAQAPATQAPAAQAPAAQAPAAQAPAAQSDTSSVHQDALWDAPTLLRPSAYLCANCAGRFPARGRPAAYCSPRCAAEAKAVRYARRQRATYGESLPEHVRTLVHRKMTHALTECDYDKWSGQPEPDEVTPPAEHPLAGRLDTSIPRRDVYALRAHELTVRICAGEVLRPCDAQNWDSLWRGWVNAHAA